MNGRKVPVERDRRRQSKNEKQGRRKKMKRARKRLVALEKDISRGQ